MAAAHITAKFHEARDALLNFDDEYPDRPPPLTPAELVSHGLELQRGGRRWRFISGLFGFRWKRI